VGINHSPKIVTDNLVLCLDAANPLSYPGSGSTWYDLSGNNNNGTLINSPVYTTNSGGAFTFNGTTNNRYVDVTNINIGNKYSIICVFKSTSIVNYKNIYDVNYNSYTSTGNVGPRLEQYSTGNIAWGWSGNTSNNSVLQATSFFPISSNQYYHTVFTMNFGSVKIYINGEYKNTFSSPNSYVTTFNDINIGRGFKLVANRYFNGDISIFQIYNKDLLDSEVSQNYNALKGRFGL
jgi:hypothetical protein